ncbi:MAG: DnaD domain protein [Clostridia bacterium]|nr:DnaD domain protein [Clostridia bacterium]
MSFSTFSKDITANMYTSVENQFITKYLPQADGDCVRAYLYGLYLCQCAEDFDAASAAKLLGIPLEKLVEIFVFWEECDLVRILSRNPLYVEYLPVNAAVGKPKSIRPEKYAQFNREFYKLLQRANTDFKPYEIQRILEFLENNPMQQQAFLLVAEYCFKKDGEKLSASHILNKANKLCKERKYTYEQVEQDLADFNLHEKELRKIFVLLGIYRKPQESDYDFLDKWSAQGLEINAVYACAEALKKGSLSTLDSLAMELVEKDALTESEAREYLKRREELTDIVFKTARKLGVKVQNPRAYSEAYAEKWLEHGYDEESLLQIASLCLKLGYAFSEMDHLIDKLYGEGIVDDAGVKMYCAAQEKQLRLIQRIQSVCGVVKKTQSALDMVSAWQSWNFSEEMIMEAARRSANASAPLPYMNKLLSEWKRLDVYTISEIPEKISTSSASHDYRSEAAIAADMRTSRERYYAELQQKAIAIAEKARALAEKDEAFKTAESILKKGEIELARAEIYAPDTVKDIQAKLSEANKARTEALTRLHLTDEDLQPKFRCTKCSDTGFLPSGKMCDCYKEE